MKLQHKSMEAVMYEKLTHLCTPDGDFVYPGDGDVGDRTGSNLVALLKYVLDNIGDKLLDADLFRKFLHDTMKVPLHMLPIKPKIKLT